MKAPKSIPDKLENAFVGEARSLSPQRLKREIEKMRCDVKVNQNPKRNIRLAIFQRIFKDRPDCGTPARRVRVSSTS